MLSRLPVTSRRSIGACGAAGVAGSGLGQAELPRVDASPLVARSRATGGGRVARRMRDCTGIPAAPRIKSLHLDHSTATRTMQFELTNQQRQVLEQQSTAETIEV